MKNKYGVVIAAGGTGTRFGSDIPKQFLEIDDIPVIAHTISKFENCNEIKEIVISVHKDYLVYCSDIVKKFGFKKVTTVLEGGKTRQQSVFKGIKVLSSDVDYVLIHDAARPMVSIDTITKCCEAVRKYGASAAGSKVVDTLKLSEDGDFIQGTVDRSKMWQIQTPQCFNRDLILKFHKNAAFEGFEATDDCMLAEHYGQKIKLIESGRDNIKITEPKDLIIAEVLLRCSE